MTPGENIVYVVGAGLSAGLGFPTIGNLLPGMWSRLEDAGIADQSADIIRVHYPDFEASIPGSYPTFEELLSVMQANEELFEKGWPAVATAASSNRRERQPRKLNFQVPLISGNKTNEGAAVDGMFG